MMNEAHKEIVTTTGTFLVLNADATHSIAAALTAIFINVCTRVALKAIDAGILYYKKRKESKQNAIRE